MKRPHTRRICLGRFVLVDGEQRPVDVEIDVDSILAQLGRKAVRSKGGKAQDLNGAVVVFDRTPTRKPERAR